MSAVQRPEPISVKDYLAGELASATKHEYVGGVICARAGTSNSHNDEGEKRDAHLTIPSLVAYLLVDQDSPTVVVHRRSEQGFFGSKGVSSGKDVAAARKTLPTRSLPTPVRSAIVSAQLVSAMPAPIMTATEMENWMSATSMRNLTECGPRTVVQCYDLPQKNRRHKTRSSSSCRYGHVVEASVSDSLEDAPHRLGRAG